MGLMGATMSGAIPKGGDEVGLDLREAARRAARRDGMSMSEWLDAVVAARAAALGVDVQDLGPDERVEAVSDRLSDLGKSTSAQRAPEPALGSELERMRAAPAQRVLSATPDRRATTRGIATERPRTIVPAADRRSVRSVDPELKQHVAPQAEAQAQAEVQAQAVPESMPTRRDALERSAEPKELTMPVTRPVDVTPTPADTREAEQAAELERVEAKLNALFRALERRNKEVASAASAKPAASVPPAISPVVGVTAGPGRQDTAVDVEPAADVFAPEAAEPTVAPKRLLPSRTLGQAIAEISQRQAFLDKFVPPAAPEKISPVLMRSAAPTRDVGTRSRATATELLRQFGSTQPAAPRRTGPLRAVASEGRHATPNFTVVREELAALSRSVADLAPKESVSSLESAVRGLSDRVEATRDGSMRDVVLAPIERLAKDIRDSVKEIDHRTAVVDLDREIRSIGHKIETMTARGLDADALQRIQDQTREVRDLLTAAAAQPFSTDKVERQIADLGQRVERAVQAPVRSVDEEQMAEIRAMLEPDQRARSLDTLEQRVEALTAKIDMAIAGQLQPASIDGLSQRIDGLQASVKAQSAQTAPVPGPVIDVAPLEQLIEGLTGKIESIRDSRDVSSLEDMVRKLADKLDDARAPQADADVFSELQAQVGQLAQRIDRSDAGLNAIVSLERSLGDLFTQIEETREAAINAAEGAARTAARDTLRAAMMDQGLRPQMAATASPSDQMLEQISQEISGLRTSREATDERLQAMMSTLGQTLERVVDRLTSEAGHTAVADVRRAVEPEAALEAPMVPPLDLDRRVKPERRRPAPDRAAVDLDETDFPIEPNAGNQRPAAPRRRDDKAPELGGAPDVRADPAQYIAAARRAAQAAAQDSAKRASAAATSRARGGPEADAAAATRSNKSALSTYRRPLLLVLAGVVVALGATQIARIGFGDASVPTDSASITATQPPEANLAIAEPTAPVAKQGASAADLVAKADAMAKADAAAADNQPAASDPAPQQAAPASALPTMAMGLTANRAASRLTSVAQDTALTSLPAGLREMAQGGNSAAQYEVALRLSDGRGVARDLKASADWFEKAARQGLAPAAYRLGSMYEKGLGVAKDPNLSVQWYQKAADQGNVRAMHNLAVMSAEGSGGKSDYVKAAAWFLKASQMGVRDSQFNLAILYARGLGIEQSLPQSYTWFAVAAAQGDGDAAKKRDDVAARLDAKSLASAKAIADGFKPTPNDPAANDVKAPAGGWDAVAPTHPTPAASNGAFTRSPATARISSM